VDRRKGPEKIYLRGFEAVQNGVFCSDFGLRNKPFPPFDQLND